MVGFFCLPAIWVLSNGDLPRLTQSEWTGSALQLEFSESVRFTQGSLNGAPARAYIDFSAVAKPIPKPLKIEGRTVTAVRFGHFTKSVFRVVFDLANPKSVISLDSRNGGRTILVSPRAESPPVSTATVVLDPGHGGAESGAEGIGGLLEKDIALDIALRVREMLAGEVTVVLTRQRDVTVSLDDRVEIANRYRPDLFISIHANSHPDSEIHGIETYFLDNRTDQGTERLVKRENGLRQFQLPNDDLGFILASLGLERKIRTSHEWGRTIHRELVTSTGFADREGGGGGLRGSLFYVLWGVHAPSLLVELGYLSNPGDAERLRRPSVRLALARALSIGIRRVIDKTNDSVYTVGQR